MRRNWIIPVLLIGIAVLGAALTFTRPHTSLGRAATAVATWFSVAAFLHERSYHRAERYRLAVDRLRARFNQTEVAWSISGEWVLEEGAGEALAEVRSFVEALTSDVQRLSQDSRSSVWRVGDAVLKAEVTPTGSAVHDELVMLRISFVRQLRTVRGATAMLEGTVSHILAYVDGRVVASAKYTSTVEFPNGNPYFGLFVADVDRRLVKRFDLVLMEDTATGRDPVFVNRDSVRVVTGDLTTAQRLSRRYLELRPMPGSAA